MLLGEAITEESGSYALQYDFSGRVVNLEARAVDAQGNVYAGEQHHGKRVQKFVVR